MLETRDVPGEIVAMRTSFNGSRSDPRAVAYARATVDLGSRDVRIEDGAVPEPRGCAGGIQAIVPDPGGTDHHARVHARQSPDRQHRRADGVERHDWAPDVFLGLQPAQGLQQGPARRDVVGRELQVRPKLKWTGLDEVILGGPGRRARVPGGFHYSQQGPRISFEPAGDSCLAPPATRRSCGCAIGTPTRTSRRLAPPESATRDRDTAGGGAQHRKPAQVGRRQVPMGRPRRHGRRQNGGQARAGDRRAGARPHRETEAGYSATSTRRRRPAPDFRASSARRIKAGSAGPGRTTSRSRSSTSSPRTTSWPTGRQARADVPRARPTAVRRQGRVCAFAAASTATRTCHQKNADGTRGAFLAKFMMSR